jgi:hypothetical protein
MKTIKYLLWSPIVAFLSMLVVVMFGIIWGYDFTEILAKIWFTLGLLSFFCLVALSTIEKAEKSNYNTELKQVHLKVEKDPILHFDKPYIDPQQYMLPDKNELPTDMFKLYYLGEFICEIERKDIKKVKYVYDLEEIKLILNIQ